MAMTKVMTTLAMTVLAMTLSTVSYADSYECYTADGKVKIKAHDRNEQDGVLVLSDRTVQNGNRTIAAFSDAEYMREDEAVFFFTDIDQDEVRGGEYIGGTRLSELSGVTLQFSLASALPYSA